MATACGPGSQCCGRPGRFVLAMLACAVGVKSTMASHLRQAQQVDAGNGNDSSHGGRGTFPWEVVFAAVGVVALMALAVLGCARCRSSKKPPRRKRAVRPPRLDAINNNGEVEINAASVATPEWVKSRAFFMSPVSKVEEKKKEARRLSVASHGSGKAAADFQLGLEKSAKPAPDAP